MEFYDICPTISSGQKRKEIGLRKKKKKNKTRSHDYITDKSGHPTTNVLSFKKRNWNKKREQ